MLDRIRKQDAVAVGVTLQKRFQRRRLAHSDGVPTHPGRTPSLVPAGSLAELLEVDATCLFIAERDVAQ